MTAPGERELHIASVLVQARPEAVARLCQDIPALPGTTLAQWAEDGRLVAVLEHEGADGVLQSLSALRDLPGVLNVALVYQHAEPWAAMQQPMT